MNSTLGKRLSELRELGGLSAAELGLLAGLSHSVVQMIECGARRNPVASTVAQLAVVVGDDGSYLLGLGKRPSKQSVVAAVNRARSRRRIGDAA
jgi:transcriptional regulator with XRE-family HTH domain